MSSKLEIPIYESPKDAELLVHAANKVQTALTDIGIRALVCGGLAKDLHKLIKDPKHSLRRHKDIELLVPQHRRSDFLKCIGEIDPQMRFEGSVDFVGARINDVDFDVFFYVGNDKYG